VYPAYVGDGRNRWPALHVLDAARRHRLALENLETGAKYHAVAEEGMSIRDIAEIIGRGLNVPAISVTPEEAPAHFGWLAAFAGRKPSTKIGTICTTKDSSTPAGIEPASRHRASPHRRSIRPC
jgi:nucleoside-diphosphate-sugar epimerase